MRKLEDSLASLRAAAREYAVHRRPGAASANLARASAPVLAAGEGEAPPQRAGLIGRVVARLRAFGRRLLRRSS